MIIQDNIGNNYDYYMNKNKIVIKKEIIHTCEYIEILFDEFNASAGDNGYYVIADVEKKGSHLCRYTEKKNEERILKQNCMPVFGIKNDRTTVLGIVTGMKEVFHVRVGIKNGIYYIALRFVLDNDIPYENIEVALIELDKTAEYSEMAKIYRKFQLESGNCVPLKERIKKNPQLKYAAESIEIRIRMGWKPAPATVLEQTEENEPEMKVACNFDRVKDIIDELKKQGIEKAQLCLVGWNKSGHDGRWPQAFPVEEKLGGEKKLRELIRYAQENGYQIVCHTNSTDCYSIADCFSMDTVIKKKDGTPSANHLNWSGGRMYHICPKTAYEQAKKLLPRVAELGFSGLHYIDVITVVPPKRCYDKNHPVNQREYVEYYDKIMELSHELFGGFASEGVFDFAAKYLDYGLYVTFDENSYELFDEEIPLWQMVYHGIILSNPSTSTVNYTIKDKKNKKRMIEYGGRPSFYFYSSFMTGSEQDDWLGKEDLVCDTDEQLRYSVGKIKEAYDEFKKISFLQTEFIDSHKIINKEEVEIVYSNGLKQTVKY